MKKIIFIALSLLIPAGFSRMLIKAQSATATLSGTVTDEQGAVVAGASVTLTDNVKAFERKAMTGGDGNFIFTQLPPSRYTIKVAQNGFAETRAENVVLNVNDQSNLRLQLKVATASATVNVTGDTAPINESPAVATVVDRQFIENQPLNGRSFQTLVELAPGVVFTASSLPTPGQFSVNGQRAGSNYFTVDGVSANFGSTASVTLYETAGGGVPSYSALGTTSSLASVDAVQEFSIQTSTYAAEFGRQPGAQVSLVTRSGTNDYHGSVFDYLRNDKFDANNFFDNSKGFPRQPLRQNDFGGTFGALPFLNFGEGGRLFNSGKDRTFFFFSYEGLRLRQPGRTDNDLEVPTLAARNNATGVIRDLLRAFPLPNRAFSAAEEADGVVGVPLYLNDAPGGRRFNPAAFDRATPLAQLRQGTLGRNALRGFGAYQLDLSLRRQFNLTEKLNLRLRADAFNIFNRANFANPSGVIPANYLTSASFGRSSQTLGAALGGLASVYQIGGPRSFQLSAKIRF